MRALIMAAALLLSSCWEGPPFYSASDAISVFEPGWYEARGPDGTELFSVVESADGMTVTQQGARQDRHGLAPLDPLGRLFVAWADHSHEEVEQGASVQYVLVQRLAPDEYLLYYPACTGRDAEIASAAGAEVIGNDAIPTCRFRTRGDMERAFRQLVPQAEKSVRIVRVSDGAR